MSDRDDETSSPSTAPEPGRSRSSTIASRRSLLGRLLAPLAVLVGVIVKFGVFFLKFFGIFLAVGGYALIWGWTFAVGVVLLILVHELGHYIEAGASGSTPSSRSSSRSSGPTSRCGTCASTRG